jgi:hypothetical protein
MYKCVLLTGRNNWIAQVGGSGGGSTGTEQRPIMYWAFASSNFHFQQSALCCLSILFTHCLVLKIGWLHFKCDGTRAETRFLLSAKRTTPFKSAGTSVQSTTGSRGVRISSSNAVYTMFRGSVMGTDYPLHSSVSPSLPLMFLNVCHHISTGL